MLTTINLPDKLHSRLKIIAVQKRTSLKDLIESTMEKFAENAEKKITK